MEEASDFFGDFLCLSVSRIVRRTKRGIALRFLFSCEVMCFGWVVFINDWMLCETLLYAFEKLFIYRLFAILAGFLFLGFSYGVYMNVSGFVFVYPMVMSAVIYGGSLEFLTVSMLLSPFAPLQVFIVSLMIQARHLFYGISMLEKFKGTGLKKLYLI